MDNAQFTIKPLFREYGLAESTLESYTKINDGSSEIFHEMKAIRPFFWPRIKISTIIMSAAKRVFICIKKPEKGKKVPNVSEAVW